MSNLDFYEVHHYDATNSPSDPISDNGEDIIVTLERREYYEEGESQYFGWMIHQFPKYNFFNNSLGYSKLGGWAYMAPVEYK